MDNETPDVDQFARLVQAYINWQKMSLKLNVPAGTPMISTLMQSTLKVFTLQILTAVWVKYWRGFLKPN